MQPVSGTATHVPGVTGRLGFMGQKSGRFRKCLKAKF